jgi:hypothetical protein
MRLTCLLVPRIFLTLVAVAVATAGPPQVLASEIETLLGAIVTPGKPVPVTLTLFTPETPLSGVVEAFNVTAVVAGATDAIAAITISSQDKNPMSRRPAVAVRSDPMNLMVNAPRATQFGKWILASCKSGINEYLRRRGLGRTPQQLLKNAPGTNASALGIKCLRPGSGTAAVIVVRLMMASFLFTGASEAERYLTLTTRGVFVGHWPRSLPR